MADKGPNTNTSTTAECVNDDVDMSSEAAEAAGPDDGHSVSGLFEFFQDLEQSEEGANDAQTLRDWIPMAISKDTQEGLHIKCDGDRTLLHVAAREGLKEAAKRLVKVKAMLNAQDETGCTPLYAACWGEHMDIVKLLLHNKADSTIFDNDDWSPLYIAARYRCSDITKHLLDTCDWNLDFKEKLTGRTPLHAAARGGGRATVRYLRDKGAELGPRDDSGWTPLMAAVMSGEEEEDALRELLEPRIGEDLQLETEDSEGWTPLLRAAESGFWDGVRVLVEAGAKCNTLKTSKTADTELTSDVASDGEGQQPLHLASTAYDHDIREQGIADSDTNSQVGQETRVSHLGARSAGYIDMVRLLLDQHADTKAENRNGKTALELAFDSGHHDRVEAIFEVFAEVDDKDTDKLFMWAAGTTQRHWIATSLFERRFRKASDSSFVNISERRSAIEWAAHAKMPKVLWLLIASSPQSNDTKKALALAKGIIKKAKDQTGNPPASSGNQKPDRGDDAMKGGKSESISLDMQDIIDNPPTGMICTDSPSYDLPTYDSRVLSTPKDYEAAMVRFYKTKGQFGNIIKVRSVEDTVYRQGPERIMREVTEKFQEHSRGLRDRIAQRPAFLDSEPKFTWVHLPATNMVWMEHLVQRIMKDGKQHASHFNQAKSFFKDSWIQVPDKVSVSRIMRPRYVSRDAISRNTTDDGTQTEDTDNLSKRKFSDKEGEEAEEGGMDDAKEEGVSTGKNPVEQKDTKSQDQEANGVVATAIYHEGGTEQGDEFKHAKTLEKAREKYQKLLDEYNGINKIIHGSSTLDESYYHFAEDSDSAKDRNRRNETQVATDSWREERDRKRRHQAEPEQKKTVKGQAEQKAVLEEPEQAEERKDKEQMERKLGSYWLLIRVNQLWIWTINNKWLISASSHPIDDSENELFQGILDHLEKLGEAGGSDLQPGSTAEMSQLIIDYCVDYYERKPKAHEGERPEECKLGNFPSIRQTFSKSINSIARDETNMFEKLSKLTRDLRQILSDNTIDHNGAVKLMDDELARATVEAEDLSCRVKDILDELSILEATVQYQQDVQRAMKNSAARKAKIKQDAEKRVGKETVLETELTATYIINDIKGLGSVAQRVHGAVNTTLSLQQSEIANLQAKLSIKHAELAAQQSRVLMVFTVVTILFLPLSFLTSLFALDVASFQQAPPWALGVIFSVSFGFFIPMVIFTFFWKQSKKFISGLPSLIKEKLMALIYYLLQLADTSNQTQDRDGVSMTAPASRWSNHAVQDVEKGPSGGSDPTNQSNDHQSSVGTTINQVS
ncbi:hypothetical protein CGLO_03466 [Colletotrichum gloeosporioides Cg-14]|uniref:Uncharacterized protein n=1 Tax=Colletotrichum gloeosporioides (strain Cg-14) TaxID=1237896 RepID=T0KVJ3_COLGC|nr:hypothetical protein CGLO_03466 [Colletotrichum gloeosporioides Cg-14]